MTIESDEVHRQFPPDDDLFQKSLPGLQGSRCILHCKRNSVRSDMAEMQIGRKLAGAIDLRVIALDRIGGDFLVHEFMQSSQGLLAATPPSSRVALNDPESSRS